MQFSVYCIECVTKRYAKLLKAQRDQEKARICFLEMQRAMADAPENVAAPYLVHLFDKIFGKYFHREDRYAQIKKASNDFVLSRLGEMRQTVDADPDPLKAALRYARLCNYIDYGPLGESVSEEFLDGLLKKAADEVIDEEEYGNFLRDLDRAKKLLYIADNAGEIVADRLVIEKLRERRPELDVCVCVRGGAVINDALYEDAETAGIPELARVIDNGSSISGTQIQFVGDALRHELETADVILSKGQGNFETMHGCGLNVYYVFLCKCDWFVKLFHLPMLSGMFLNENRVRTYDING